MTAPLSGGAVPARPLRIVCWALSGLCLLAVVSTGAVAADATAGNVTVGVSGSAEIESNATTTASVVATDAATGVSAYNLTVESSNASVATVTNVTVHGDADDGPLVNVTRTSDNKTLTLSVALLDAGHGPAPNTTLTLASVEVASHTAGSANISITSVETVTNESVDPYATALGSPATVTVVEPDPPSVGGGGAQPPSDDETDPEFEVSALDPEMAAVEPDSTVEIAATITNVGSVGDNQDVELRFDNETVASESVTLGGGGSTEIVFTGLQVPAEVTTVTHGVFTDDDNQTGTLSVEHPADETDGTDETDGIDETDSIDDEPVGTDDTTPGFTSSLGVLALIMSVTMTLYWRS